MESLSIYRKAQKIRVKSINLDARTIKKIESGKQNVSVSNLRTYLEAIGLRLCYCLAE